MTAHRPPTYLLSALGYLKMLMRERNITGTDLARSSGLSQSTVSLILSGQRQPSHESLDRIMRAVGLRVTISVDMHNLDAGTNDVDHG